MTAKKNDPLAIDETLDDLLDEEENELEEEELDTDGSTSFTGSAPEPDGADPEEELEKMVGEIDDTKPFTLGDRFNKKKASQ